MRRVVAVAGVSGFGWLAAAGVAGAEVFVYPRPGVGQEQMRQDQYECHTWATTQTGFDPSQPVVAAVPAPAPSRGGGPAGAAIGAGGGAATGFVGHGGHNRQAASVAAQSQAQQQSNADRYERSYAACMAGRGYQVR